MRCFIWCVAVVLLGGCGGDATEPSTSTLHTLDFAGKRHSLLVALHPGVEGFLRTEDQPSRPFDLEMGNEAGYPARVRGNGRRSVAFVGKGGRAMFDTARACEDAAAILAAFPDAGIYFSPGLRHEELVEGTVFLAKIERGPTGENRVGLACILIERIEDTRVTIRLSIGPPWSP